MIRDEVMFASHERRNAVGHIFHVFSWGLFGGDMLPHTSEVADLVAANGFLIDSKSRSDSCGFLHPVDQLIAHETSFPQPVLYADWGYVTRYKSRRKMRNGERRRLSAVKNMHNSAQLARYLSTHTTQLYIIDASVLAQMYRRTKRGRVKGVGNKKLKPHIVDDRYGKKSLTVSRSLLQAICAEPALLQIYGLNSVNFVTGKDDLELNWVLSFNGNDKVLYEELFHLKLDVYYIVRPDWLEEIRTMIANEQAYQSHLANLYKQNYDRRTTVPF